MPHVVTQSCCSDASCVYACPVNCIQPTPDSPEFALAEMLFIDPRTCVDCGACVAACPVEAIKPEAALTELERPFAQINADYHRGGPVGPPRALLAPSVPRLAVTAQRRPPRVAVVGSGPAAMYAADEVLTIPGAQVTMYERLTRPYGLARYGVAPDHQRTRRIAKQFEQILAQPGLTLKTGVEIGSELTHDQLLGTHDAVVYAVGAASDKRLEIPGAELPHVASATAFVGWYNGHPDFAVRDFVLAGTRRVVVVGNGNVALDVARILTVDPDVLADTEIAPYALQELRRSTVEEVVVVGRRGVEQSAFTLPELIGAMSAAGVELVAELEGDQGPRANAIVQLQRELQHGRSHGRRIVLRWRRSATEIEPGSMTFDTGERIEAGLVLTSIGYHGRPVRDLPFDEATGTVPNHGGRVSPGVYVAGWIKRGPTGFIGTNKACAQETVRMLVEDHNAGLLTRSGGLRGSGVAAAAG